MNPDLSWSGFFVFEKSIQTVDSENFIVLIGNVILAGEIHFMKKYKILLFKGLFPFSIFFFCACDQSTQHRKLIINNSDYDLVIVPRNTSADIIGYASDSIFVGRHSQTAIFDMRQISRLKDYKQCNTFTDTLQVIIVGNNSLHLTLDLNDRSNWKYFTRKKELGGGGECECQIGITNEDIQ